MNSPPAALDIKLILSDVDGVLSDGGIIFNNQGIEMKKFHVRDGLGIKLWQRAGYEFGILTARTSQIVKLRAAELGINIVRQGFEDKLPVAMQIIQQLKLEPSQVCYIGDDLTDIAVIQQVGLGVAVSDAAEEVQQVADHQTTSAGGAGAVRELIEMLLKTKGRWHDLVRHYHDDPGKNTPVSPSN
ncbi:MAG: HAD hydrolase family protein [Pirellulaceae bacterium]|jgi:YrbI family 3-deoxy-D-manno-octulosonate 8-phosphate phosphatase|nr:HAD hydrolase family protein [Pirellulaceae bacterium]